MLELVALVIMFMSMASLHSCNFCLCWLVFSGSRQSVIENHITKVGVFGLRCVEIFFFPLILHIFPGPKFFAESLSVQEKQIAGLRGAQPCLYWPFWQGK